jgi:hypothetical protein
MFFFLLKLNIFDSWNTKKYIFIWSKNKLLQHDYDDPKIHKPKFYRSQNKCAQFEHFHFKTQFFSYDPQIYKNEMY